MRGLYAIPTRTRWSRWFLVEGTLILRRVSPRLAAPGCELAIRTSAGVRIELIGERAGRGAMKCFELLWRGLATRETPADSTGLEAPGRVLLREVHRSPDSRQWDLLVSPHAWLTLSLTDSLTESDPAAFLRLLGQLSECATGIDWPAWIPNDESLPAADTRLPDDVDLRVWSALRDALRSALPLEEDQVYYGLDLALLELDSIDMVMILSDLEEELEIAVPDDRMDDLIPTRGTLGSAYERLVELVDQQRA